MFMIIHRIWIFEFNVYMFWVMLTGALGHWLMKKIKKYILDF